MALRPQTPYGAAPSIRGIRAGEEKDLTPNRTTVCVLWAKRSWTFYTRQRRRADYNWPL